ncbi:MAG TPA: RNA polymerase sigma factor RpoD/SigA [Candidatus Sumerlaeota bacterium]|nr:MAG: RNA polymerase sigma factor SigA [candidate division BRC1 bacterium ADurb.Bin183]HOE63910.1 RNA polymerase sigma factor RpoD/SigA [Candidatus Sumerlaeota bacterium]HRR31642.1 RNA polymerase sigma factor RpoD/SigA [Candidatus Sumerlaeia bacterium]HON51196.1 RNA polymerase sigma factor RpoD/SigA [Candidatus Sumerlaeota bacterium]HOR64486.1 RNA polymerase sigma factor RpoD/SigA [Candidatus Sumerlaeota bacterium]
MNNYDESVQFYMKEAASYPILSREKEIELFQKLEDDDQFAFEDIVKHNLRFVINVALHYNNRGVPLSDLIQEGNIGLLEVVRKYDWRKGYRFSTYASFWIRQSIQLALRRHSSLITLPIRKSRLIGKISEVISAFTSEHGFEPSVEEISKIMDIKVEVIQQMLKLRETVLSLDQTTDEDGIPLMERIPDTQKKSPLQYCMENQTRVKIAALFKHLNEKERRIMNLRFGFEHGKTLSLRKTSRLVGLSQEGVRRIERKALSKLNRPVFREKLEALL